jgi:hypothetical protein
MLAYHRGLQISGRAVDARGLDYMLPARVAPALLRALDRAEPQSGDQYRRNLLIALGSIDHPTQATLDAVRKRLDDDDPWTALGAVKAAGMLGRHAAEAADTLASMLDSSAPGRWHWEKGGNGWLWLDDQGEIAVALARVSEGAPGRALDALLRSARDDEPRSAARAVEHLRDLGTRARPAVEDLMSMLREGNAAQPTVTEAVLSISPELFPDVVSLLVGRATSDDLQGAWVADRELLSLNSERAESPEMRAAAPALIAALERRLPSDGLQLSKVVRRLDTGEAHAAYDAYRSRERRERGVRE